jgi:hypothetical protein
MDFESPSQLLTARQFLIRQEVSTDDTEHDLRAELFLESYMSAFREPQFHVWDARKAHPIKH